MKRNRREMLAAGAALTMLPRAGQSLAAAANAEPLHLATNTYPWSTFARRDGKSLALHTDALLGDIAGTGIDGYEPIIQSPGEMDGLGKRLRRHGLEMRSIYVNSVLHDPDAVDESIEEVVGIAEAASKLGTRIVVTNPAPIRWGGPENKTDDQLRLQAKSLDHLGSTLRSIGLTLAYHNHDAELRQGAREFHHMLTATDPANVKFCLDAHWIFRGCGDSEVAVMDALSHYHDRVVELHLRQSTGGVWTEVFSAEGDIDYGHIFRYLEDRGIRPHLVLEQAVEAGTRHERNAVEAHRASHDQLVRAIS